MGKVIGAHSVSADGYITGREPGPGRGLGDGGQLFDWYFNGDTPSQVFDGFRLSEPSARVFDTAADRVSVTIAGRNTYEDSDSFGGGSPHPRTKLIVVSHRPVPQLSDRQEHATSIEGAIARARDLAGAKDIALMGGGVTTAALQAGLVDEIVLHQIPVLLG